MTAFSGHRLLISVFSYHFGWNLIVFLDAWTVSPWDQRYVTFSIDLLYILHMSRSVVVRELTGDQFTFAILSAFLLSTQASFGCGIEESSRTPASTPWSLIVHIGGLPDIPACFTSDAPLCIIKHGAAAIWEAFDDDEVAFSPSSVFVVTLAADGDAKSNKDFRHRRYAHHPAVESSGHFFQYGDQVRWADFSAHDKGMNVFQLP